MRYEFKLPDIGEGIAEAEIVAWHVKIGDVIGEDQQIADMMTDKATVEMESPVAGKVVELAGEVGDQIPIGSVLAVIETAGADRAAETVADSVDERPLADGAVEATPEMAEEIPVTKVVEETKPVRPEPVEGLPLPPAKQDSASTSSARTDGGAHAHVLASPAVPARGPGSPRKDETIKVVGLRRKIAENMAEANRRVQHFTLVEEFDVTALEETRQMMNRDRGTNPKLTLLPFLITALSRGLAEWPMLNATFDDEAMVVTRHGAVHMGVATQTTNGLMVATIRDAQSRSVWELAAEILRLSDAARSNKATREELTGATVTISSLGPMGGITSTPVVNPPQVAIVAVNKIEDKLIPIDDEIEVRKRMNLSLSCDHRVVDGWDAANFMQALKGYIENPLRLLSA